MLAADLAGSASQLPQAVLVSIEPFMSIASALPLRPLVCFVREVGIHGIRRQFIERGVFNHLLRGLCTVPTCPLAAFDAVSGSVAPLYTDVLVEWVRSRLSQEDIYVSQELRLLCDALCSNQLWRQDSEVWAVLEVFSFVVAARNNAEGIPTSVVLKAIRGAEGFSDSMLQARVIANIQRIVGVLAQEASSHVTSSMITLYEEWPSALCRKLVVFALLQRGSAGLHEISCIADESSRLIVIRAAAHMLAAFEVELQPSSHAFVHATGSVDLLGAGAPALPASLAVESPKVSLQPTQRDPCEVISGLLFACCTHFPTEVRSFVGVGVGITSQPHAVDAAHQLLRALLRLGVNFPDLQYSSVLIRVCAVLDAHSVSLAVPVLEELIEHCGSVLAGRGLQFRDPTDLIDVAVGVDEHRGRNSGAAGSPAGPPLALRVLRALLMVWSTVGDDGGDRVVGYLHHLLEVIASALPLRKDFLVRLLQAAAPECTSLLRACPRVAALAPDLLGFAFSLSKDDLECLCARFGGGAGASTFVTGRRRSAEEDCVQFFSADVEPVDVGKEGADLNVHTTFAHVLAVINGLHSEHIGAVESLQAVRGVVLPCTEGSTGARR